MKLAEIVNHIENLVSHITFDFKGLSCGIDPISLNHYEMWCGEETAVATTIEEVLSVPFFDGLSLKQIIDSIENIDM